ncbi:heterokaryon incompatibility protein-domain-containing protein [Alternaria rosae]|uniref:heterokaryon incompatibility protein-domain-containing protein n=1 Tax=Alternaria rosae TaxID=1187941 RepID=UPI001E8CCC3E|nr:heterokaryon incompatibility protein-domain-containing protein [Alternaria rosae]KAH6878522.1 heterokaryon incompatibility protein-domain-containing protein [Alternaria rosae]
MQTSSYQYRPLQHSNSIRILVLHPSPNESDPIECTICHEDLANGFLCYEAVSYTWGSSGPTHTIRCNDAKESLSVGRNCHAALRRLRLLRKCRKVWIDAVCINQEDLLERGHQVRMMKEVYDGASGVIIMLNDVVPECRLLLDELAEVDEIIDTMGAVYDRVSPSEAIVRQLETLLEDPWFERTWVLQEIHEKLNVCIMYGSAVIQLDALESLYFGHSNTRVTRTPGPAPMRFMSENLNEYDTPQFELWNRLYMSRKCLATDPRDRVFALKSLLGSRQAEMDHLIDYAQSVEECFKRVAKFLLPVLGLRLLAATRHPHGWDMASWIPDWSQTLPLQFNAFYYETFGNEEPDDVFSPTNIENQERALLSYSYNESHTSPTLHVVGCQYAQIVESSQVFRFVNMDDVERQTRQIYNQFNNLRQHLNEESKIDDIETPGHFSGKIFDAMASMDGGDLDMNLARFDGSSVHFGSIRKISIQQHSPILYEALQECSIALMQNGELAIVPGAAQDGDVVCIVAGATAPCVLRQSRGGCWMLVSGDCHIFGDEDSNIAASDAYVDSHRSQVERFVLR